MYTALLILSLGFGSIVLVAFLTYIFSQLLLVPAYFVTASTTTSELIVIKSVEYLGKFIGTLHTIEFLRFRGNVYEFKVFSTNELLAVQLVKKHINERGIL